MGSGFNFFTNGIDKTPSTTGQFTDVDVSGDGVPSGATGVILKIVNTGTAGRGEVRKNGSTDDFGLTVQADQGRYALVGVDANRIFEAYIAATTMKIYLIGYTDENCGFFDNAIEKTPGATGWQDIDVSGDIPSGATGVICLLYNNHTALVYSGGIRKNGSTDTYPYGSIRYGSNFYYQLCGVDANRVFEANAQNLTYINIMLVGYTKSPVTFFDNGIDKSLSDVGAWTDIDVTGDTTADTDGAIILIKNTSTTTEYQGDVRKNGSTDNHIADMDIGRGGCGAAPIGVDSGQILEGYIENVAIDFYLIGYCKPAVGVTYIDIYDSGAGTDTPSLEASMIIAESGSGLDAPSMEGQPSISDSGLGSDVLASLEASLSLSDSATGTDTATAGVPVDVTDSGVGSDIISELQVFLSMPDSGIGSDMIAALQAALSILESGTGVEVWTVDVGAIPWAGLFGELEVIHPEAETSAISPSGTLEVKHPKGEMEIIKR